MLGHSPAGDRYGCENDYIEFDIIDGEEAVDIGEVMDKMEYLKSLVDEKKEKKLKE